MTLDLLVDLVDQDVNEHALLEMRQCTLKPIEVLSNSPAFEKPLPGQIR